MKRLVILLALVGCSSAPTEGTYTVTTSRQSGTCQGGGTSTWTITDSGDGDAFLLEYPGVTGGCRLLSVGGDASKLQGKCTISVGDALAASDRDATLVHSLEFTSDGLKGDVVMHLPKATSYPTGCDGTLLVAGKRK